ncbi:carbohydrate ABC transporter permease [Actinocrispum wychmicini]|uniref:sn-glycerol 3-phosphate transport system permease protein n=1 Tax=Actinocrispum wychmicini TaxID=1213861 RepID=A0A4R2JPP9_9PSEU|nr:sugar ABC transporter permease [Actinocrispum wychmicini]TCO62153.1 sn-glycerol 3-phosphate transport system permease protein [Actinocrispum wychmicini]
MIARLKQYRAREVGLALLFLVPSLAIFVMFFFVPLVKLLSWGTYKSVRGGASYRFVGLQQYVDVLTGKEFLGGVWRSVAMMLITVPAGLVLGVLLATAAHRRLRGIKVFQTIFSTTIATSGAVAAVVFAMLINPTIGVFKVDWLQNPDIALFAVSLSLVWQTLGVSFVIVLAGLQAVPEEVLEAARLDGYGPVRRMFRVTVPLISPVLLFLAVVLTIFALQAFAQIELLTQGGPGKSTQTLLFTVFHNNSPETRGVGAVQSVGMFVLTGLVALLQFGLLSRRVHYGD